MNRSLRRPLNTIRGRGRSPGSTAAPRPASTSGIPPLKSTPRNMFTQNIADTPPTPSITPTPVTPLTNDLVNNNNNNNKRNNNRNRKIETKQNSKIIPPPPQPSRTSLNDNYNGIRPPYS